MTLGGFIPSNYPIGSPQIDGCRGDVRGYMGLYYPILGKNRGSSQSTAWGNLVSNGESEALFGLIGWLVNPAGSTTLFDLEEPEIDLWLPRTMKHLGPDELEMGMIEEFGIIKIHGPWRGKIMHLWWTYAGDTVIFLPPFTLGEANLMCCWFVRLWRFWSKLRSWPRISSPNPMTLWVARDDLFRWGQVSSFFPHFSHIFPTCSNFLGQFWVFPFPMAWWRPVSGHESFRPGCSSGKRCATAWWRSASCTGTMRTGWSWRRMSRRCPLDGTSTCGVSRNMGVMVDDGWFMENPSIDGLGVALFMEPPP